MALVICKECGKQFSNKASACPNCGAPLDGDEKLVDEKAKNDISKEWLTPNEESKPKIEHEVKQKTNREAEKKIKYYKVQSENKAARKKSTSLILRTFKYMLLAFLALIVLLAIIGIAGSGSLKKNNDTSDTDIKQAQAVTETVKIFEQDLLDDWDSYKGKQVETTIIYSNYLTSDKRIEGKSLYSYAGENSTTDEIYVYLSKKIDRKDYSFGDFITVKGMVSDTKYELTECEIVNSGTEAKNEFNLLYEPYKEKLAEIAQANEEEFRNGELETPSYEELLRYPSSYEDKRIKLTVYISEKEADGVIIDGTIWGTYQGQQVVIDDERTVKEPEILTGDTLTIYGYGGGTTTIKTYVKGSGLLGTDLGADVVDKTEVPKIKIVYCDFN